MCRLTSGINADGEVVWFWRPDAGAKFVRIISRMTVAKEPGHREEHEGNRNTIARGKPVWLAEPVVTNWWAFFVAPQATGAFGARLSLRPFFGKGQRDCKAQAKFAP